MAARQAQEAQQTHRTNRWLTIFLPILVSVLVAALLALGAVLSPSPATVGHAAAVVVIFAALGGMVALLPTLVVLIILIVWTRRARQRLPTLSLQILTGISHARQSLLQALDQAASPIIRMEASLAAWRAMWRTLRQGGKK